MGKAWMSGGYLQSGSDVFEMLTGAKPFDSETAMGVIVKHRQAPLPELPAACQVFEPLVRRMLAKLPADRFQSVEEVLAWQPSDWVPGNQLKDRA